MKAMIFAAGLGTRLRPLTDSTPKALIEVGGRTMLERVILKLRDAGVSRMVVNVHHHAAQVVDYLNANGGFGADISVSDETGRLLDTGGGVVHAASLLRAGGAEPVVLHNADILTDFPLGDMIAAHELTAPDATLLVARRKSSRGLLFDGCGVMGGWWRTDGSEIRPAGVNPDNFESFAFGGVHIIAPSVIDALEEYAATAGEVFSITPFYADRCRFMCFRSFMPEGEYRWFDIGRPETLRLARAAFSVG